MKRSRRMRAVLAVASALALVLVAVRLMDIGRAMPLRTMVLDQRINSVAVDERTERTFIATGRDDGSGAIDVLDTRSGAILRIIQMRIDKHLHRHDHPVMLVVDTSTNRVFVTRIGNAIGSVSTLDAHNGKILRTFSIQPYPTSLAVDEHLGYVFVASSGFGDHGGRIYVLDARSGRGLRTLDVPKGNMEVAVDSRVHRVIVATHMLHGPIESTRLEMRDARSGRLLHSAIIAGSPAWRAMAVDEGTARAFVLTVNRGLSNAGRLSMLDTRNGRVLRTTRLSSLPEAVAVDSRTGHIFVTSIGPARRAATVNPTGLTRMGSAWTYVPVQTRRGTTFRPTRALRLSNVTLVPMGAGRLSMFDARSGALVRSVPVGIAPQDVAVNACSGRVFVANMGPVDSVGYFAGPGTVSVLDSGSGAPLSVVRVGIGAGLLAPADCGRRLFVVNSGGDQGIRDDWAWMPPFIRSWLPLPRPSDGGAYPRPGSVTMFDLTRT